MSAQICVHSNSSFGIAVAAMDYDIPEYWHIQPILMTVQDATIVGFIIILQSDPITLFSRVPRLPQHVVRTDVHVRP